jgi:hypothetical protein
MTPDSFALPKFFMGYAFLKFAQKIDTLLRIVGMNTAATGNDMLRSLGSTVGSIVIGLRAAGSMGGGALGGIFGGGSGGSGSNGGGLLGRIGSKFGFNVPGQNTDIGGIKSKAAPTTSAEAASDIAGKTSAMDRMTDPVKRQWASGVLHNASNQFGQEVKPQSTQMRDSRPVRGAEMNGKGEGEAQRSKFNDVLDKETKDGLAGIAHGLPHNQFDPETGQFNGGGFRQYKGQEANIIGANQFQPSKGFEQSTFKSKNGESSVVYGNPDTGEAFVVNFSSVDNGVVTGTVQEFDTATGSLSSPQEFSAVHNSVAAAMPEFHTSNIVGDGGNGSYAVSSEANTSFFAAPNSGAGSIVFKDGTVAGLGSFPAASSSGSGAAGSSGGAGNTPSRPGGIPAPGPSGGGNGGASSSSTGKASSFSGPTPPIPPLKKTPASESPVSSSQTANSAGSSIPPPSGGGTSGGLGKEQSNGFGNGGVFEGHGSPSAPPAYDKFVRRGGESFGAPGVADDIKEDAAQVDKTDYHFKFAKDADKSGNVTPFRKTVGDEENLTLHPKSDPEETE